MSGMEETFTDKEFCQKLKIDRATSFRWRENGIVGFIKFPNGQVRYKESHINDLVKNFEKMDRLGVTLKDVYRALKSGVVSVGVAEGSGDIGVPEHPADFSNREPALHKSGSAGVP